ncbi:MAG: hypothetical protein R3Y12_02010 [Clostridia bacterium]
MNNKGNTLAEVVVALIIFGLSISMIYPMLVQSTRDTAALEQSVDANRVLGVCSNALLSSGIYAVDLFNITDEDDGKDKWISDSYDGSVADKVSLTYGSLSAEVTISDYNYVEVPVQNTLNYALTNENDTNPNISLVFNGDEIRLDYDAERMIIGGLVSYNEWAEFDGVDIADSKVLSIAYYYDAPLTTPTAITHNLNVQVTNKPSDFILNIYFIKKTSGIGAGSDLNSQYLTFTGDTTNVNIYSNATEDIYNGFSTILTSITTNVPINTINLVDGHNVVEKLLSCKANIRIFSKYGTEIANEEVFIS